MRSEDEPLDTLEAAKAAEPRPRAGLLLIPWLALLVVVLVGAPLSTFYITKANGERDSALAQRDVYAKQAEQLKEQVKSLGAQPVVTPSPVPSSGPTAKALTGDEVRSVVTDELSRYKLTVTPAEIRQISRAAAALVPKPKDGKTPTPAELQTYAKVAVASYCLEDRCVRQPKDGKDGADSTVPGPKGEDAPKVTDEELLRAAQTALAAYCAQDDKPCAGMAGPSGPAGQTGPQGRGITDMDCLEDGAWRISYTDGTTGTARGPCRVVAAPPAEAKK